MESGIEDCYLRLTGHESGDSVNTGHVGGVVERRDVVTLLDHVFDFIVNKHTFAEFFSSVNYAVAHCVDFVI